MTEILSGWYIWLSQATNVLADPVRALLSAIHFPILSAFLFGVLGSLSPCQLTGNLSALAFASQRPAEPTYALRTALGYTAGKVFAYLLIGAVGIALGAALEPLAIPFVVAYRRALGPAFLVIGLYFLGAFRLKFGFGYRLSDRLSQRGVGQGMVGAFVMGFGFSLSFCPTLFLLFFTWVLPLSLEKPWGGAFPGVFGIGTAAPFLGAVILLSIGGGMADAFLKGAGRANRPLRWLAGGVFLLAGLHDTLVYWAI